MAATNIHGHADVGVIFGQNEQSSRKEAELQTSGSGHTSGLLEFGWEVHHGIKHHYGSMK